MSNPKEKQKQDSIKFRVSEEGAGKETASYSPSLPLDTSLPAPSNRDPEDTLGDPHAAEHEWLEAAQSLNEEAASKERKKDRRQFLIWFFSIVIFLAAVALLNGALNPPQPIPTHVPSAQQTQVTKDIDFKPYMEALQKSIKSHWHPPKGYDDHVVRVKFKVHKNGEISNLAFDRMSRSPDKDAAVIKAIIASMPSLPPLPEGSPDNVDIMFTFEYHVTSGPNQNAPAQPNQ